MAKFESKSVLVTVRTALFTVADALSLFTETEFFTDVFPANAAVLVTGISLERSPGFIL